MPDTVVSVEHLSKAYRLGQIGTGTLSRDLNVWWARVRGKPNPLLKIGQQDHSNRDGETIWALKDVSFEVKQGEVLGIIGRNGAGKSTLLKIITGVTAPTSGQIKAKGRVASLLEVGTGFHPELTGRENIFLNGAILGMKKEEITRKFDEIVAFSEVEQFIDTPVKRYSSGMYVRLAFAVAAHLDPEILLVDEVLAVGDAAFQKKCLGKMGDIARGGRTVVLVSHNMGAVRQLCPQCVLLRDGSLANRGASEDVIQVYAGEGARRDAGTILNHIARNDPIVVVDEVRVNGHTEDVLYLKQGDEIITIDVNGSVRCPIRMDVEFRLSDSYNNTLAFFSPGYYLGMTLPLPAGEFHLRRSARLPRGMTSGFYYLNMQLTEPNVRRWVELPNAVIIHHEGVTTRTGASPKQSSRDGWLFLEMVDETRADHVR